MTDIAIITSSTYIKAEPGLSEKNILKSFRSLRTMESVTLFTGSKGTYVEVRFSSGDHWTLDVNKKRGSDVTLNGIVPADNDALTEALSNLLV